MINITSHEIKNKKGEKPNKLIFILHGYGADGANMLDIAEYYSNYLPNCYFVCPNGCQRFEYDDSGYQWFSLIDRSENKMYDAMVLSAKILNKYIDSHLNKLGLTDKDLILIGFSQGAMMSLYLSTRRENDIAGVVGFSGMLLGNEAKTASDLKSKPQSVLLLHGDEDDVVPYDSMEKAFNVLQFFDIDVKKYRQNKVGHYISNEALQESLGFLEEIIHKR